MSVSQSNVASQSGSVGQIVAPNLRNRDDLTHVLAEWLAMRLPGASSLLLANFRYPVGAGLSHETILFDAQWRERGERIRRGMVVRIKPTGKSVFFDDMFEQQYELMCLMHRTGAVPVATPLWFEHDPQVLGAPFFVMEKGDGRGAGIFPPYCQEGRLSDSTPGQRHMIWEDSVRKLAGIQNLPISEAPFLDHPCQFDEPFVAAYISNALRKDNLTKITGQER